MSPAPSVPAASGSRGSPPIASGQSKDARQPGLAATVALSDVLSDGTAASQFSSAPGVFARALAAIRYVFVHVHGRIDDAYRKRSLVNERDTARSLVDSAFAELGQIALREAPEKSELTALVESIRASGVRRATAIDDAIAAEKFHAAEDVRLGRDETAAENEWKACARGASEVDEALSQLDADRRKIDAEILRERAGSQPNDGSQTAITTATTVGGLAEKRARLEEQYGKLRERAAALRAATIGAEARLDQAIAARRQGVAAGASGLVAHARDRAQADTQIRQLTIQAGRVATGLRLSLPALQPGYRRIDRLEQTAADCDRQIAGIDRSIGRYDRRKLALGLGILSAMVAVLASGFWVLLR